MKNMIINVFKQLNIAKSSALAVLVVIFLFVAPTYAKDNNYETRISFDKSQVLPLAISEKRVEVVPGLSTDGINQLNQNPTPERIKAFMKQIAPEYGVDWKLVFAIGYHESGNYSSSLAKRNNNYFGRKATSNTYASWSTPEEGIRNEFVYLRTKYIDRGLTTPATINRVYAEGTSWKFAVQSIMDRL